LSDHPFPGRFRRRITLAFVSVAGLSAGALALGAAVTVDQYRTRTFVERAREQVHDDVRLLAAGAPADVVAGRLAGAEQPGGPAVIVVVDGDIVSSVETVGLDDVPSDVRREARRAPGQLAEGRAELRTGAALVLGTVDADTASEVYFFFPRGELDRSIREFRYTLGIGWMIVVIVAGLAGTVIARRTLRPVRNAANAARSVAEGLLDTRLPVQSGDEFGVWAGAFNEMVGALEQKISALADARGREQRFAADIAHELRTPIASVLTAATHLVDQEEIPPEVAREVGDIIVTATLRLDRLTSELLELHRLEAGQADIQTESVDLVASVAYAIRAHGWTEQVTATHEDAVLVETDRRRLDRIIVNLIGNGLTHGGGHVDVEVRRAHEGAWIIVSDRGPGMAQSDLDHVFDRHYKASDHRASERSGSGLGLAIALESAQVLGGRLTASSVPGRGSTFTLWLPDRASEPDPAS
jgi:two-component system sensor histidine kinase MtrB